MKTIGFFLLGMYFASVVIFTVIFLFFEILGGKGKSRVNMLITAVFKAIFWPFALKKR